MMSAPSSNCLSSVSAFMVSNHLRKPLRLIPAQIAIERHTHITDQQAATRQDADVVVVHFDQADGDHRLQAGQAFGEVVSLVEPVLNAELSVTEAVIVPKLPY